MSNGHVFVADPNDVKCCRYCGRRESAHVIVVIPSRRLRAGEQRGANR